MLVTIDSAEPLESVLAVLGSVYQVQLQVASLASDPVTAAVDDHSPKPAQAAKGAKAPRVSKPAKAAKTAGRSGSKRHGSAALIDAAVVRAWAREHDMAVSVRGQLPGSVVAAYRAAEH